MHAHTHTQTQMQLSLHICMTVMTECSAVNVIISSSSPPTVLPPVLVPRSPAGLAIDTSPSSSISPVCTPLAEEFSPLSSNPPSYGSSHTTMNGCVQASMLPGKGSSVRVRACVCGVCVYTCVLPHVNPKLGHTAHSGMWYYKYICTYVYTMFMRTCIQHLIPLAPITQDNRSDSRQSDLCLADWIARQRHLFVFGFPHCQLV